MNLKKTESLNSVKEILTQNSFIAVYQKNGLSASETTLLKQYTQQYHLQMKTVKNTSVKVILKDTPYGYFSNLFEGPCVLIYSQEMHPHTSQMFAIHKKFNKLVPLGALVQNAYLSAQEFDGMASFSDLNMIYGDVANLCLVPLMGCLLKC